VLAELSGRLSDRSPPSLLRLCEEKRFCGHIEFSSESVGGVLQVLGGFVEKGSLEHGTGDPAEAFLALSEGRFRLRQRLPTPSGEWLDEPATAGTIGPHLPAELLRFCETSGLTGTLTLANGPRHVLVAFRLGEIDSIALDGETEAQLQEAWAWTTGEWAIAVQPFVEPEAPRRPDETGRQFLEVVESELSRIMEQAEGALPPPRRDSLVDSRQKSQKKRADETASRRLAPHASLPPRPGHEPTVRIYYLRELVPSPVLPPLPRSKMISRTDLTEELVDVPPGIEVRTTLPPQRRTPSVPPPSPWPYVLTTLLVVAVTALVLWILD